MQINACFILDITTGQCNAYLTSCYSNCRIRRFGLPHLSHCCSSFGLDTNKLLLRTAQNYQCLPVYFVKI